MVFDSHIHTKFSTDSNMDILEAIAVSKEKNIGIIITEHLDLDYPKEAEFRFDIAKYFNDYEKYRNDKVKLGIEIGLTKNTLKENEEIASKYDFDYVLGSIHAVRGLDIYLDYINLGYNKREFFTYYLEEMLTCVNLYNNFDSLAHIDYPCRYCNYDNKEILVSEFKDILAEIFKSLINKGKVLELNTNRLQNKDAKEALIDIYKLYRDLGGKYITLGSDSHNYKGIYRNFHIGLELMEHLKLKGIYFNKRKIEYIVM